jgi:hypothetical protein
LGGDCFSSLTLRQFHPMISGAGTIASKSQSLQIGQPFEKRSQSLRSGASQLQDVLQPARLTVEPRAANCQRRFSWFGYCSNATQAIELRAPCGWLAMVRSSFDLLKVEKKEQWPVFLLTSLLFGWLSRI